MAYKFIPDIPKPVHMSKLLLEDLNRAGVYFLYHKDELVYVGQTRVLILRLDQHLSQRRKVFDAVAFIPCTVDRLTEIEGHYIRKYAPRYNACGTAKFSRLANTCRPAPMASLTLEDLKPVDAAEFTLNIYEAAEFLGAPEKDVSEWHKAGLLPDLSVLTLFKFAFYFSSLIPKEEDEAA